ncbi:MAG: LacI family DNA-binding transcriptional regulator [Gammaproteobacteria bacterium]
MNKKPQTTIKDIADYLGISHTTVSRALNDKPTINEKTKTRVRQACRKLGYIQNVAAKTMRGSQSSVIGLIVPDIENVFYAGVAKSIAQACNNESFQLLLMISEDDPEREYEHIKILREYLAAGVIIIPSESILPESIKLLKKLTVVQMLRVNDRIGNIRVTFNDKKALALATRHLLDLGHTRIAYIGGLRSLSTGEARYQGFCSAIKNKGISLKNTIRYCGQPREEFARKSIANLVNHSSSVTAVVFGGTRLTESGIEALMEHGLSIPDDISVIGYGDPPWFRFLAGGITTIRLPVREFADHTASRLFDLIRKGSKPSKTDQPVKSDMFEPAIIIRSSSRNL